MKLTNPTDAQLEAAFAEHVAGWQRTGPIRGEKKSVICRLTERGFDPHRPMAAHMIVVWKEGNMGGTWPKWATSADAVLPWLEKWHDADDQRRDFRIYRTATIHHWGICIRSRSEAWEEWKVIAELSDASLARIMVIAILRAHGVEVTTP